MCLNSRYLCSVQEVGSPRSRCGAVLVSSVAPLSVAWRRLLPGREVYPLHVQVWN